jgi:zinc protease
LEKVKAQMIRDYEEVQEDNGFWLNVLHYYFATAPNENPEDLLTYSEDVNAVTAEEIRAVANKYLSLEDYVKVVLHPEASQ